MLDVDGAAVVVGKLESCHLEAVCSVILDYQADDLFPVEQIPHFFMSNNEGLMVSSSPTETPRERVITLCAM